MTHKLPPTLTKVTLYSKFIALFLVLLFPFAGFYIGMNYQRIQDQQKEAQKIVVPTLQPTVVPISTKGASLTLAQADNGKTYTVKVGEGIVVNLGSQTMHWTVNTADPAILRSVVLGIAQRAGDPTVARFTAVGKGTTKITGEGRPLCPSGSMCAQYLINYAVTITVE